MAYSVDYGAGSLAVVYPDLASEWHPTKNGSLTPATIARASNRKVWWQCSEGHEWEARVYARAHGSGCPYCKGRKAWPGFNDLETVNPILASEWHPQDNGDFKPTQVTRGSARIAWWQCKCGNEFEKTIHSRSDGSRCKICSKGNEGFVYFGTLDVGHPKLAEEWHPTLNKLTPADVSCVDKAVVWWQCEKGHSYRMSVGRRYYSVGCPVCKEEKWKERKETTNIAVMFPELVKEWHPRKNGDLRPRTIFYGSGKKVWWMCALGHEWQATPAMRSRGQGCPYCAGRFAWPGFNDLATAAPDLAAQWHPTKNGTLTPDQVTPQAGNKVWWFYRWMEPGTTVCREFEWEASIITRYRHPRIPFLDKNGNLLVPLEGQGRKKKMTKKEAAQMRAETQAKIWKDACEVYETGTSPLNICTVEGLSF